jgi:hypothetical protein
MLADHASSSKFGDQLVSSLGAGPLPRDPSHTVPYKAVADHLETFLASLDADPTAKGLPAYVQREFYDYLRVASSPRAFSAWDVHLQARDAAGLQLQAARIFVRRVPAGGWSRPRPTRSSK